MNDPKFIPDDKKYDNQFIEKKLLREFGLTFEDGNCSYYGTTAPKVDPLFLKVKCCFDLIRRHIGENDGVTRLCVFLGDLTLIVFNSRPLPFCYRTTLSVKQAQKLIARLVQEKIADANEVIFYEKNAYLLKLVK